MNQETIGLVKYNPSEQTRRRMSEARKRYFLNGGVGWNRTNLWKNCVVCDKKIRVRPSCFSRRKCCSFKCFNLNKKNIIPWNKGLRGFMAGEKSPSWKGGVNIVNERLRHGAKWIKWRDKVYKRYFWTCQGCGYKGKGIVAHHIKPFADFIKLRFRVSNGVVLCRKCHQNVHRPRKKI